MRRIAVGLIALTFVLVTIAPAVWAGVTVVNGWYEGEEIYYLDLGVEEGVTELGSNQIFLIGAPRLHQANVVLHVPGEPGYSPHWNVNIVHTAPGITVQDILDAGLASPLFFAADENGENLGTLFDDVEDIWAAQALGLVTVDRPGVVVLCPVVSERTPNRGNNVLPEDEFEILDLGDTF